MNWVQTKHRLPEMGMSVLIYGTETNIAKLEFDCAWRCNKTHKKNCKKDLQFRSSRGEEYETWDIEDLTHWSHLPEPSK